MYSFNGLIKFGSVAVITETLLINSGIRKEFVESDHNGNWFQMVNNDKIIYTVAEETLGDSENNRTEDIGIRHLLDLHMPIC